jgi:integrin beta 2
VVFSNRHELRRVDVATSNAVSLISGLRNTIALDFYYKDGVPVLFWTDVMEDKIYRGIMAGNGELFTSVVYICVNFFEFLLYQLLSWKIYVSIN